MAPEPWPATGGVPDARHWLTDPEYAVVHLRLENAHAAVEPALIEARRKVRINEGRES